MKAISSLITLLFVSAILFAQPVVQKIEAAMDKLISDSQTQHAIIGFYVINSKTGAIVYDKNAQVGLVAASSQKVITSTAALELLGTDFTYKTELGYKGTLKNGALTGDLVLTGSGDPSFGSWRYANTKEDTILRKLVMACKAAGIKSIQGNIVIDGSKWETQTIPGGWTWTDIGNYYGAGVAGINWHENQYDLKMKPGTKVGDSASIISTTPKLYNVIFQSELTTGAKGSGDQVNIYLPPQSSMAVARGTIPLGENPFTVSGSIPDPVFQITNTLKDALLKGGIKLIPSPGNMKSISSTQGSYTPLYTYTSPSLDSLNFWFLKRSINLYGEALVKTIAAAKTGFGSTDSGLNIIRNFWKERRIDPAAIRMIDGSGLSPQNRITTNALVTVMQYAKTKEWYSSFYNALPTINNLKMKSGSIGGARSFTGYINSKDGNEYTFAIIINNYSGSSSAIERKLWIVLDSLK